MSKNCDIVKDLLPLYADEVCSEESRKLVAEHIAQCSECRSMLEKMGKSIAVDADNDIKVMKRIKKRIRTEKIVVGLVLLTAFITVGVFLSFIGLNTMCPMDINEISIGEELKAEVDENGDLWLKMKNYSATEDYIMPTLSDNNGRHFGVDKDFDKSAKEGMGLTLMHRKIDSLACFNSYDSVERMVKFINVDEDNIDYVFYYDSKSNKEYVLWERESND